LSRIANPSGIDMAILVAHIIDMKEANIADLKNNLSKYLSYVEKGESVRICKRNMPVANLTPVRNEKKFNRTKLGCGLGSIKVTGDLTEPLIPQETWEMLKP
jgi:prevent-host-death family protein